MSAAFLLAIHYLPLVAVGFEGTGEEMDIALNNSILETVGRQNWSKTRVYPGHEYTSDNVKFVRKIYPQVGENKALDELEQFCSKHEVTAGRFTLKDEVEFNPFMRLEDPKVKKLPEIRIIHGTELKLWIN